MKYNLGLDIGTNSVGWAVVDENNDLVKKNGKTLWGVRMFDEASDAKTRRSFRCGRRRLARRKERIRILDTLFAEEINKVDPKFFLRIKESFFKIEDKEHQSRYILFDDDYNDQKFFNDFPTIYHLKKYLLETDEKVDIRMLYLACHHYLKYRGHFLNEGEEFTKSNNSEILENLREINNVVCELKNEFEDDEDYFKTIENINSDDFIFKFFEIMSKDLYKLERQRLLQELFGVENKTLLNELFIKLLCKSKVESSTLSVIKDMKYEKCAFEIESEVLEENILTASKNISELQSAFEVIPVVKKINDYFYLIKLIGDKSYLSEAMVDMYDDHQKQLKELKSFYKKYLPTKYNDMFRLQKDKVYNYVSYVGFNSTTNGKKKKTVRTGHCSKDDFYATLKKDLDTLSNNKEAESDISYIKELMDKGEFLRKQRSTSNSSIPMQLNYTEFKTILTKQAKHYDFLKTKDGKYTTLEKLLLTFKFRIPYYVGPLKKAKDLKHNHSWAVYFEGKEDEVVKPWNLEEIIDLDESAKIFIERMQNKCQYLKGEEDFCLPKYSLLFSEYNCLSYLNKLIINGRSITKDIKEKIMNEVFYKKTKPTRKDIENTLYTEYGYSVDSLNSKINEVTCSMSSYIQFKEIFKDSFEENYDMIEEIIKDITIFEDKKLLEKRLRDVYNLDEEKIKAIKGLNYKGYSTLSRKLLNDFYSIDEKTGEVSKSIIEIMRDEPFNLQEIILSDKYSFRKAIDEYNIKIQKDNGYDGFLDFLEENIYVSPIMKRSLIQTYKIIEELEKILGQEFNEYYIECAREKRVSKTTKSRYNQLKEMYAECKKIANELPFMNVDLNQLEKSLDKNQENLKSEKIYLYFTQLGKDMYTLKNIDFQDMINGLYDVDHIYPQSIIKDDSISNKVLVHKNLNNKKTDKFLFELPDFLPKVAPKFYESLATAKLISKEKLRRLTKKDITDDEFDNFVNRQLVATNQSVKGVVQLLKLYKQVPETKIIYSKAGIISEYRHNHDLIKSRVANNYHHAHDAYLNAVLGKTVHKYFDYHRFKTNKSIKEMHSKFLTTNPNKVFNQIRYIYKNGEKVCIWDPYIDNPKIRKNIYERFDILETTRTYTKNDFLSKVTILKAGDGNIPVKTSDARRETIKYGGFLSYSFSSYSIIKYTDKKGKITYSLESIPAIFKDKVNDYISSICDDKHTFEVVKTGIKINSLFKIDSRKCIITGKTGNQYLLKNAIDRNFDELSIKTIKKLEKYNMLKLEDEIIEENDNMIVLKKETENQKEMILTIDEINCLIEDIKLKFDKNIYSYSAIKIIKENLIVDNLTLNKKIELCNELLKLLKTNERVAANLKVIGMSQSTGTLYLNKNLKSYTKILTTSVTGFYEKVIFEVPSGI